MGQTATQVSQTLREGNPSIWVRSQGNTLYVTELWEGNDRLVAARLRAVLSKQ